MNNFDTELGAARLVTRDDRLRAWCCGAFACVAGVSLLALAGWFITAAALAGSAGAALSFNYLLPSAGVRACAIVRTAARYGERLCGHGAALALMAVLKPRFFRALAQAQPERALAVSAGEAATLLAEDCGALESHEIDRTAMVGGAAGASAGVVVASLAGPLAAVALLVVMICFGIAFVAASKAGDSEDQAATEAAARLKTDAAAWIDAAGECACYQSIDSASMHLRQRAQAVDAAKIKSAERRAHQQALIHVAAATAAAATLSCTLGAPAPITAAATFAALATIEALGVALRARTNAARVAAARARLARVFLNPRPAGESATILQAGAYALPLHEGERILITGPSGAGKTTALKTLLGLHGDNALAPRRFGYAPQDAQALSGAIRENLAIGNANADDNALWRALWISCLDARVRTMSRGLDTWIGDGGARLSGGERRRLAIARAIIAKTDWLVLDEPSEGLDAATERLLIERLDDHMRTERKGLIVVTHRLAWKQIGWDHHMKLDSGLVKPQRAAA